MKVNGLEMLQGLEQKLGCSESLLCMQPQVSHLIFLFISGT